MEFFKARTTYTQQLPGTTSRMIFDCQAIITAPDTGKSFATGFTTYEGSGLWREIPVNYRNFDGWEPYEATEPFFEAGVLYEYRPGNDSVASGEFLCVGVVDNPTIGTRHAVGYWRMIWKSGKIGHWSLESRASMRDWYPAEEGA